MKNIFCALALFLTCVCAFGQAKKPIVASPWTTTTNRLEALNALGVPTNSVDTATINALIISNNTVQQVYIDALGKTNAVTFTNAGNSFSGSFSGSFTGNGISITNQRLTRSLSVSSNLTLNAVADSTGNTNYTFGVSAANAAAINAIAGGAFLSAVNVWANSNSFSGDICVRPGVVYSGGIRNNYWVLTGEQGVGGLNDGYWMGSYAEIFKTGIFRTSLGNITLYTNLNVAGLLTAAGGNISSGTFTVSNATVNTGFISREANNSTAASYGPRGIYSVGASGGFEYLLSGNWSSVGINNPLNLYSTLNVSGAINGVPITNGVMYGNLNYPSGGNITIGGNNFVINSSGYAFYAAVQPYGMFFNGQYNIQPRDAIMAWTDGYWNGNKDTFLQRSTNGTLLLTSNLVATGSVQTKSGAFVSSTYIADDGGFILISNRFPTFIAQPNNAGGLTVGTSRGAIDGSLRLSDITSLNNLTFGQFGDIAFSRVRSGLLNLNTGLVAQAILTKTRNVPLSEFSTVAAGPNAIGPYIAFYNLNSTFARIPSGVTNVVSYITVINQASVPICFTNVTICDSYNDGIGPYRDETRVAVYYNVAPTSVTNLMVTNTYVNYGTTNVIKTFGFYNQYGNVTNNGSFGVVKLIQVYSGNLDPSDFNTY